MTVPKTTLDHFLGGRLVIEQPKRGQRAGSDAVLLAAAVPAQPGLRIIEFGTGHGVALLCVGARVAKAQLVGVEIQTEMAALARINAERNGMADRCTIIEADIRHLDDLPNITGFDHAFANPPWFEAERHQASAQESRALARTEGGHEKSASLTDWLVAMVRCLGPEGGLTLIQRWERCQEITSSLQTLGFGGSALPLSAHAGEAPKRVIIAAYQSVSGFRMLPALILHRPRGGYSDDVEQVLRHGAPLPLR